MNEVSCTLAHGLRNPPGGPGPIRSHYYILFDNIPQATIFYSGSIPMRRMTLC